MCVLWSFPMEPTHSEHCGTFESIVNHLVLHEADSTRRVCPCCGSHTFWRSNQRGIIERFFLNLLRIRPYRCSRCDNRFYSRSVSRRISKGRLTPLNKGTRSKGSFVKQRAA